MFIFKIVSYNIFADRIYFKHRIIVGIYYIYKCECAYFNVKNGVEGIHCSVTYSRLNFNRRGFKSSNTLDLSRTKKSHIRKKQASSRIFGYRKSFFSIVRYSYPYLLTSLTILSRSSQTEYHFY